MGDKRFWEIVTIERYDEEGKSIVDVKVYANSKNIERVIDIAHFLGTQGFDSPFMVSEAFDFYRRGEKEDIEKTLKKILDYLKKKAVRLFRGESEETSKQNHIYYLAYLDFADFI